MLNEATKSLFDEIALITHANGDLNHRRRDLIKPELNRSCPQICSEQIELTENLFGDYHPQKIKDIITTNKVGNKLTDPNGKHTRSNRSSGHDFRLPYFSKKRSTVWMEIPDPSTEMEKQPEEQSISSEEKRGGESPEEDQVSQVGSTIAQALSI